MNRLRIPLTGSVQNVAVSAEASDVGDMGDEGDEDDIEGEGDVDDEVNGSDVDDVDDVDDEGDVVPCDGAKIVPSMIDSILDLVASTAAATVVDN